MRRKLTPDELNQLESDGYNTSSYKGELVEFPDPPKASALAVGSRSFLANALPATAGAAGFAGGMSPVLPWNAAAIAAAPETMGISLAVPVISGIIGGMGASAITGKAQESILPESVNQRLEQDALERPLVSKLGALGASALTMRPSLSVTRDAIRGIGQLPAAAVAGGSVALNPVYKSALSNVGMGAGISGATEVGRELATEGTVHPLDVLGEAAIGAAFNKPAALGKTVMRLPAHSTGERNIDNPEVLKQQLGTVRPQDVGAEHVTAYRDALVGQRQFNESAIELAQESIAKQDALNVELERVKQTQADLAEATGKALEEARYSKEQTVKTPGEQEVQQQLTEQKIPAAPSKEFNKSVSDLLTSKNIATEENINIPEKGMMRPSADERKVFVNPTKETVDTRAHEGQHYELTEIEQDASNGNIRAKSFLDSLYGKQKELLDNYNKKLAEQGKQPADAHEFATTEQGAQFIKQQLNLNKEGPWRKWWNDTKALWNTRFGKNPSNEDLQRALNYRFVNRVGEMGTIGKRGPIGEVPASGVRPVSTLPAQRNMSSDEGFNSKEGDDVLSNPQEDIPVRDLTNLTEKEKIVKARLPFLKDDNLQVTVQNVPEIPQASYVQIDETNPKLGNTFSSNAETLKKMGYDVPTSAELQKLPTGKYTLTKAKELLQSKPTERKAESERGLDRTVREEQQNSPEFKEWFGDSKVVDDNKKPLIVYHGTTGDNNFSIFKSSKEGTLGKGIYFTPTPEYASAYTAQNQFGDKVKGGSVFPTYVTVKNPLIIAGVEKGNPAQYALENLGLTKEQASKIAEKALEDKGNITNEIQAKAIAKGYDGIITYANGRMHEVVAFRPEQIKSATGNSGAFNPTNPDIRHSEFGRGLERTEGESLPLDTSRKSFLRGMESTFDKVERVSTKHAQAARDFENRRDQYTGLGNVALSKLDGFSRDDVNRVMSEHRKAYRTGEEPNLSGEKDQAISQVLKDYYGKIADVRRDLGIRIAGREAGKNEYYVPDMLNAETLDMFINDPSSPESKARKNEWAEHVVTESGGKLPLAKVKKDINEYVQALNGKDNNYLSLEFGAIRRAAGYGLPESMRDGDAISALARYNRRAASDLAFFQEIQNKPEIAGPLHLKNQEGDTIPGYEDSDLPQHPLIKDMMQWVTGNVSGKTQKQAKLNSIVRLVNNALLGPATGLRDLASVPANALPYIDNFSDLGAAWRGLMDFRKNSNDALRYAARQPSVDRIQFNELLNAPDRFSAIAGKVADGLRKYQGREALENTSRDITFSVGKELGRNNVLGAKAGNEKAQRWLSKFSDLVDGDVTKMEGQQLEEALNQIGKNFTDRNQGTYGGRGLPLGVVDSQFAPFLNLQKWAIEKSNVIYKDVYKPFITGENRLPMLTYTLGSLMTGAAIQQLNELMSGRKSSDPTVKEAWTKGDAKSIIHEVATLMQLGSYAGILSDGLKTIADVGIRGKTPRNIVSFPTATAAVRTGESVTDMLEALRQGENPWEVLKAFALDTAVNNVQTARLVANHTWKTEDIERSDKFRDRRVFNELEGKPAKDFTPSNPYLGLDEKKFKRATSLEEASALAPEVVKKAIENGEGNPLEVRKNLRSLKGNSYQTIPNPHEDPVEFAKYYNFLVETQGRDEANARVEDYVKQSAVNKVKSRMIP